MSVSSNEGPGGEMPGKHEVGQNVAGDSADVDAGSLRGREPLLISVIVPALNAAEHLADQLGALSSQDYTGRWEVVVVDNGSTDSTVAVAQRCANRLPSLRIVDASRERGIAFARNAGVEAADGDLLAFCDADDRVNRVWLSSLAEVARSADLVGAGFSADNAPVLLGFLPFASGGSMMVWRYVVEGIGGFDPSYRGAEDVDFSWRAQLAGYHLGFAPNARIDRGRRTSLQASVRQMYKYGFWDAVLARDYRDRGLPPKAVSTRAMKTSIWLTIRVPYLLMSGNRRLLWLRTAANLLGLVSASSRRKGLLNSG